MPTKARFHMRMVIDAMITTGSLLGICWYFLIGPQYLQDTSHTLSPQNISDLVVSFAYPTLDAISLLAFFLLMQRKVDTNFYIPYLLFILSLLSTTWGDMAYAYLNIFGEYQVGTAYIDTFWFISQLLGGMAGLYYYTAIVHEAYQQQNEKQVRVRTEIPSFDHSDSNWLTSTLHIYSPFITLLLLCIYAEIFHAGRVSEGLVALMMLVSIIVAVRYILTNRENDFLLRERESQRRDSENLRLLAIHLNQILDMDKLLERTVCLSIKELGFTTAILLLSSQKDRESLPIQVYATSNNTPPITWHIRENALLQRMAQTSKEIEMHWSHHLSEMPPDIRIWLQQQQLVSSYFLPLYYQDKLLGCLAVTDKRTRTHNQHMLTLGRAYCEQVATIIEHARLYQEAREHETFANAMTTIAVRLNSAVVDPAEIGDLICQEATKALRTDYVILYLINEQGLLEPCALSRREACKEQELKAWPCIYPHEYEAQALHISEPMLQQIAFLVQPDTALLSPETHLSDHDQLSIVRRNGRRTRHQYPPTLHERLMQLRIHSTILAPLIVREKAAGVLIFARAEHDSLNEYPPFNSADLPLAQNFVEQARVAFTNARLYQRLKNAHQRLQELDQLKDQFMITTSHELRTPLTAVQGYIELLTSFGNEITPEQQQDFLQKARQSCEELVVLLSNIMDTSRLEMETGLRPLDTSRV
ncbi:MAG TPA: GAF domain-containing protein, partial [Ktedonobacteraceae bacterium]